MPARIKVKKFSSSSSEEKSSSEEESSYEEVKVVTPGHKAKITSNIPAKEQKSSAKKVISPTKAVKPAPETEKKPSTIKKVITPAKVVKPVPEVEKKPSINKKVTPPIKVIKSTPEVGKKPSTIKKVVAPAKVVKHAPEVEKKPSINKKVTPPIKVVKHAPEVEKKPSTIKKVITPAKVVKPTTPKVSKQKVEFSSSSESEGETPIHRKPPISKIVKKKVLPSEEESSSGSERETPKKPVSSISKITPVAKGKQIKIIKAKPKDKEGQSVLPKKVSSSEKKESQGQSPKSVLPKKVFSSVKKELQGQSPKIVVPKKVSSVKKESQGQSPKIVVPKKVSSVKKEPQGQSPKIVVPKKVSPQQKEESQEEEKMPVSPLIKGLPKEIIEKVFQYTNVKEQMRLIMATSGKKAGTVLTEDNIINSSKVNLIDDELSFTTLIKLIQRYPGLRFTGLNIRLASVKYEPVDWSLLSRPDKKATLQHLTISSDLNNIDLTPLEQFPNLITLRINGFVKDISKIAKCKKLEKLDIDYFYTVGTTKGIDLTAISQVITLKELELHLIKDPSSHFYFGFELRPEVTDLDLSKLKDMEHLATVTIDNFTIVNKVAFPGCNKLAELSLDKCGFANLDFLSADYQLTTLSINFPEKNFNNIKGITSQKKLKSFTLTGIHNLPHNFLEPLSECTALTMVIIKEERIPRTVFPLLSLGFVANLPELQTFDVETYVPDMGLQPLESSRSLKTLHINPINSNGELKLPQVEGKYTGLTTLILKNTSYNDGDADIIGKHTLLTKLIIKPHRSYPVNNLDGLTSLHNMEELTIFNNFEMKDFSFLENMTKLRILEMLSMAGDFTVFNKKNALTTLSIKTKTKLSSIEGIERLTSLEFLELRDSELKDINALTKLRALKSLELYGFSNIQEFVLTEDMPKLKTINLRHSSKLVNLEGFEHCPNLKTLTLEGTSLKNITTVGECANLKTLTLQNTSLKNITTVGECANLITLNIRYSYELTDISAVSQCTSLARVELNDCYKLDNVTALFQCTKLKALTLTKLPLLNEIASLGKLPELTFVELKQCTNITDFYSFAMNATSKMLIVPPIGESMQGGNKEAALAEDTRLKAYQGRK